MEEKKTFKEWINEKQELAKCKIHTVTEWCKNNKDSAVIIGTTLIGGIIEIIKISSKRHIANDEKKLKERYIYDRPAGHYWELKREPKKSEWLQIDQRRNNREPLGEILNDMRLLKL